MVHTVSSSIATSTMSRPGTSMSMDTGYSFQRFNALTVDDLFHEMTTTEIQYIQDLESMRSVRLVEELLISHCSLEPSLTKVLEWAEEAAPIYNQYVKEYVFNPDETQEMIYLKRRPLVRLRFYAKFFKKLQEFLPNVKKVSMPTSTYRALVTSARAKVESEKLRVARLQVDFSRVRSFDNLQPVATWFNSQLISMRSYCQCHLSHRSGKTFSGLPVEILLISEPLMSDALAICQLHEFHRYLLFPTFRRADLVYFSGDCDSAIALSSYNGSRLELEFSSMENRNTWAAKFQEIFPPAPDLPPTAQRYHGNTNFKGLEISTTKSEENDGIILPAEILESELQSPRLFEEPEIKRYIVGDTSPQKKRHSVLKYGSMIAQATQVASQKAHVRFSRMASESKIACESSSASPSRRRQRSLQPSSSIQTMILKEEESPGLKPQVDVQATERNGYSSQTGKLVEMANGAALEEVDSAAPSITEKKSELTGDVTEQSLHPVAKLFASEIEPIGNEWALHTSESTIQVVAPSRDSMVAPAASVRASVYSERSIVPETYHSTPTIVQHTLEYSRNVSLGDSKPKSMFSFTRRKDYPMNGSPAVGRVSSVFRKISPRQNAPDSIASDANNENAVNFNFRKSISGKRASTATSALSPVILDNSSPGSVSTEFGADGTSKSRKQSSSFLRNMKSSRSSMRSSLSNLDPSVPESSASSNKSIKSPSMAAAAVPPVEEGPTKLNIFSRSARKARAALSQVSWKVEPDIGSEDRRTILTVPPPTSLEGPVVAAIRVELASKEPENEAEDEDSKTKTPIVEQRTLDNQDPDQMTHISQCIPPFPTAPDPEPIADGESGQAVVPTVHAEKKEKKDDLHLPKVSPLKINSDLKPQEVQQPLLSPGYPPSPGEYVDTTLFTSDGAEVALKSENFRTQVTDGWGYLDRVGIDEVIQEVETFTPRINLSRTAPLPSPPPSDSASAAPPTLPELPLRVGTSRLSCESRSSRSSRASTVRDSKATIRAVPDLGLERYVLVDTPMSDSEGEENEIEIEGISHREEASIDDTYRVKNISGSFPASSERLVIAFDDEDEILNAVNSVAPLNIEQRTSLPSRELSPVNSAGSMDSNISKDSPVRCENRPSSPLKYEYAPSSNSSGSVWDDSASVSEDATSVSVSATTPSPTLHPTPEDMKIVLFRSNCFVYEWSSQHRWDRICENEVHVIVTVTEDSGAIEVWPATAARCQSIVQGSRSSIPSAKCNVKSVQFSFADNALSTSNDGPMLTIPLNQHVNIRRSTAFDIHVKKVGSPGITMFRTRTAIETDHMFNAMNSCRLDFHGLKSRPFSSSAPSIASSESSSHSSIGSSMFGSRASIWYHPSLDSASGNNSGASSITCAGEVLLVKDFKCRLFLRQNALKWRNLGPAKLSITGVPDDGGNKVTVKRHDGQVLFDLALGQSSFERVGRTGLAVHVMNELAEEADAVTDGDSRVAVYMLQFKGEKDTILVDRAIKERV
ncbi:hypothetical protein POJ06DRAFT_221606 [Lipomyces tetrasporus]|uniref:PH domain-containing protein n=1 Tax=Lipomyces tetrasporus TaxID=54092 RepID=A0AAD7QTM0_9ASCO|nr:uncharacterized protein POJ06DRAFT_221606 [Lipomyces tetrasporus]KAJ8101284.1 hypothetical protein POJ06DRAFT_221606 [Lipomyces tetrasporus]